MYLIDQKFKEVSPDKTVKKIQKILTSVDIEVQESWNDSGLSNCFSLNLYANGGNPFSNGKGITKDFAQASAYAEFIERLQGGLFFYKNQSIIRDKEIDIHTYAPDAKYMSVEELEQNGEWMDYLIKELGDPSITRNTIAKQCKIYACTDTDNILTLPFYSLFEDKYVYLPIGFIDQIYATNGCCAGNTREEAWVHAFSEILERHATLKYFLSGEAPPQIPEEVLQKYPIVSQILSEIRTNTEYNVEVFDLSDGIDYPIVSTRIISKKTHKYQVNVSADPIFEIALHRTFTELFQGRNINKMYMSNNGTIINTLNNSLRINNIVNQLETGNGLFTADYFANELCCNKKLTKFTDNSDKNNRQLLQYAFDIFRHIGCPVYVRNFSFLGFPCYRFVVPGFSEAFSLKITEKIPQYALGDDVAQIGKQIKKASDDELNVFLMYNKMIKDIYSRYNNYGRMVGVPLTGNVNLTLANITRAYAAFRLNRFAEATTFLRSLLNFSLSEEDKMYIECIIKYIELLNSKIDDKKIRAILPKFFYTEHTDKLFNFIDNGLTPFDDYLLNCDTTNCHLCKHKESCAYERAKKMVKTAGAVYSDFVKGQDKSEFSL